MLNDKDLKFYDKLGIDRPSQEQHGEVQLERLSTANWRMEGNALKCDTPSGTLVQMLPTDVVMTGVDDKGLPIFKRIYKD